MNYKLKENMPYVIICMILGLVINHCLHIDNSWLQILSWIPMYYIIFWVYQWNQIRPDEFSILAALKQLGPIIIPLTIVFAGYTHCYYHALTLLDIICFIFIAVALPVIMERSLYN